MEVVQQRQSTLAIAAQAGELRRAAAWLQAAAGARGVPGADIARLDMCLHEAVANVIDHGGLPATAQVQLTLEVGEASATLTLSDKGKPFDPTTAPQHTQPATLEETLPGGLGLVMIRSQADTLHYQHHDGCNRFALTVQWTVA